MPRKLRFWEARELALVNRAVLEGRKPKDLEPYLPGRTRQQIQNACNAARKRLRGQTGQTAEHKEQQRADRASRVRQGICTICGGILDDDGTLTRCSDCCHQRGLLPTADPAVTKRVSDLLPWIYSRQLGNLASHIPTKSRLVVDLFAGSGRFSRAASRRGFEVVYNDIHPLLPVYAKVCRDGRHGELNFAMSELAMEPGGFDVLYRQVYEDPSDEIMAAAVTRVAAFNLTRGCHLDEVRTARFAPFADSDGVKHWRDVEMSNLDYADALDRYDRKSTTFFVDCPYPGTEFYEHNMSWAEFGTMLGRLKETRGNVLMVLPTQRRTVKRVADHGFHLYLRHIKAGRSVGRDLVASTYPIKGVEGITPLDPDDFGLVPESTHETAVDRVVRVVAEAEVPVTRQHIAKALRDQDVWGAITRARAEGRLVRVGRGKYALSERASA